MVHSAGDQSQHLVHLGLSDGHHLHLLVHIHVGVQDLVVWVCPSDPSSFITVESRVKLPSYVHETPPSFPVCCEVPSWIL